MPSLTDAQKREIVDSYQSGKSAVQLAKCFGVSAFTVKRAVVQSGGMLRSLRDVSLSKHKSPAIGMDRGSWEKLYCSPESGLPTVVALASALGMKRDTVRCALKAFGIPIRPSSFYREIPKEQCPGVIARYQAGETARDIAHSLGRSQKTILILIRQESHVRDKSEAGQMRCPIESREHMGQSLQKCTGCGEEKPIDAFYARNGRLIRQCAACICDKRGTDLWMRERSSTPQSQRAAGLAEIAWAAGFLEGEAHFAVRRGKCGLIVHQVDREPLEKLQLFFGGTIAPGPKRYEDNPNWNKQWIWQANGPRARGIWLTVFPLLSARRQESVRIGMTGWRPRKWKRLI